MRKNRLKKILIIRKIHESGIELLKSREDFIYEMVDNTDSEILRNHIQEFDGIAVRTTKLNSDLINKATKLKIISRHGVGYDNIDTKTIKEKNITLAITGSANAAAVAEHVMFMILSISKGKEMYDKCVRSGEFAKRNLLPKVIELSNKKILIAGFGRVGQSLIKRCKGFEMDIYVFDPFVDKNKIESLGGKKVEVIGSVLGDIDYISLHMPLNEKTKNMVNFDLMKKMKNTCVIVNTARGGIINELDLNKALNENIIYGAGLDVFENEPPSEENPLLKNKKVFLSPHTASFTGECMKRMGEETIKNIIDFFDGKLEKSMIVKLWRVIY